jgi:Putative Zn-dependent protease, contains TPR repeats
MKKTLILIVLVYSVSVSAFAIGLDTLKVSLPSLHWALQLNLPGFELQSSDVNTKTEGRYISAYNDSLAMDVSINMQENSLQLNSSKAFRDTSWVQLKNLFDAKQAVVLDSTRYESGNCAFSDFFVASIYGSVVNQRNIIVYLFYNNVCVTVQVIKSNYKDADVESLNKVLGSMKLIAPYQHVSLEYFIDGVAYFNNGNYQLAARILQKALDENKSDQLLSKDQQYWLISNLGLAYGFAGQLGRAVATLNYGIRTDPYFPMFYYNLAGVYAMADDLTETIYYLFQAFQYKKNMAQGNEFPNPKKDELFRKYWKNEKFRDAVRNL